MELYKGEHRDPLFGRLLVMILRAKRSVITREDNVPYLVRYTLHTNSRFSIKIHHILISDDACPHDHPWAFRSLILTGGYWEHTPPAHVHSTQYLLNGGRQMVRQWFGVGRLLYRPANWVHRLEVPKPMWTLVMTYKKTKDWGFWSKGGFMNWREYNPLKHC